MENEHSQEAQGSRDNRQAYEDENSALHRPLDMVADASCPVPASIYPGLRDFLMRRPAEPRGL